MSEDRYWAWVSTQWDFEVMVHADGSVEAGFDGQPWRETNPAGLREFALRVLAGALVAEGRQAEIREARRDA